MPDPTGGIISAVVGAGTSLYGSNKQAKANAATNAANAKAVSDTNATNKAMADEANKLAWAQWLLQRGINPGSSVTPGVIPQGTGAVNTRMPAWATVKRVVPAGRAPIRPARSTATDSGGRSWSSLGL